MKNKINLKKHQNGITLIALVVTIIILLILAGISIAMLTGENGILKQAKAAKDLTNESQEEERLSIVTTGAAINETMSINEQSITEAIQKEFGSLENLSGQGPWKYKGDCAEYIIKQNGEVINLNKKEVFYVYHSSDQSVDVFSISQGQKFDITKEVKDGYLYGGYYNKYNKAGTYEGGMTATYDGEDYKGGAGSWSKTYAFTENGTEIIPEAGKTYYLKEVPDGYFRQYHWLVCDNQKNIIQMCIFTAMDDINYSNIEFKSNSVITDYHNTTSFNIENGDGTTTKYVIKDFFGDLRN